MGNAGVDLRQGTDLHYLTHSNAKGGTTKIQHGVASRNPSVWKLCELPNIKLTESGYWPCLISVRTTIPITSQSRHPALQGRLFLP
jgi:hypothetical protein